MIWLQVTDAGSSGSAAVATLLQSSLSASDSSDSMPPDAASNLAFVVLHHGRNATGQLSLRHHQSEQKCSVFAFFTIPLADKLQDGLVETPLGVCHVHSLHYCNTLRPYMDISPPSPAEDAGKEVHFC
jgi:hypothetical protein